MRRLNSTGQRWFAMLLSPLVMATISGCANYVTAAWSLRGTPDHGASYLRYAFMIPFGRELLVGYVFAIPLLFLARRLGIRKVVGFMAVAAGAALPAAVFLSTPRASAMFATEEELRKGTQWASVVLYLAFASTSGLVSSLGAPHTNRVED